MKRRFLCLLFFGVVLISSGVLAGVGASDPKITDEPVILLPQHLPMLAAAVPFVSDPADKAILMSSVHLLQCNRKVTVTDLDSFAREQNVNRSFYKGTVFARGDFGHAYIFPRLLYSLWSSHIGGGAYLLRLPAVCSYWDAIDSLEYSQPSYCEINDKIVLEGNNSGIMIGGIAGFTRDNGEGHGFPFFEYRAVAILIMVRS